MKDFDRATKPVTVLLAYNKALRDVMSNSSIGRTDIPVVQEKGDHTSSIPYQIVRGSKDDTMNNKMSVATFQDMVQALTKYHRPIEVQYNALDQGYYVRYVDAVCTRNFVWKDAIAVTAQNLDAVLVAISNGTNLASCALPPRKSVDEMTDYEAMYAALHGGDMPPTAQP